MQHNLPHSGRVFAHRGNILRRLSLRETHRVTNLPLSLYTCLTLLLIALFIQTTLPIHAQEGPVPPAPYFSSPTPGPLLAKEASSDEETIATTATVKVISTEATATGLAPAAVSERNRDESGVQTVAGVGTPTAKTLTVGQLSTATHQPLPTAIPTPTPERIRGSLTVAVASNVPESYASPVRALLNRTTSVSAGSWLKRPLHLLDSVDHAGVRVQLEPLESTLLTGSYPLIERVYVVVVPFNRTIDDISLEELRLRWQGLKAAPLYVLEESAAELSAVLGTQRISSFSEQSWQNFFESEADTLGIIPFEQLDPRYKVLTVDGVNPLDNHLDSSRYSLTVALTVQGTGAAQIVSLLQPLFRPRTNRDPNRLTTLVMTGVTAMTRGTARRMEDLGYAYPAQIISGTLRAADITHVSNEVPFLDDCVVNDSPNNLTMCSHINYWATLDAIGTDIVGLSGNHVNDFGRSGARQSITWYRDNKIAIYGSGLNREEACAPLRWYHNGNTFAFIAALAFGPPFAWANDEQPGACYYYDEKEKILAMIERLAGEVDIVAVELQFEESYNPYPLSTQVREFRELREAGAHIVTGVQSHVPQSLEPYSADDVGGNGIIVYGLGNLFFDQMQQWATRTELIVRHTIYRGELINTEILTTVLENYAQPRWATMEEREEILTRIFNAAPALPKVTANVQQ